MDSIGVKLKVNKAESGRSSIKLDAPKDKLMDGRKGRNWTLLEEDPKKLQEDSPTD